MNKTFALLATTTALAAAFGSSVLAAVTAPSDVTAQTCSTAFDGNPDAARIIRVSGDDDEEDEDEDDCEDEEEEDSACSKTPNPAPAGTVAPPPNGLFGNGAPPQVKVN